MILIVGLGNPGKKYRFNRHNIGRLILTNWQKVANFPNFRTQKGSAYQISKGVFHKKKIILTLPETFMNLSGKAVGSLAQYYKIKPQNIWVLHDDIDLPLGKIKIIKNRGGAGHRGVESIIKTLGTKDFVRFRIGIKPPSLRKIENLENFVLQDFPRKEGAIVKKIIKKTIGAIEVSLGESLDRAMQKYN